MSCDLNRATLESSQLVDNSFKPLFRGTVSDNIRNGQLDATEEEIRHAAVVAQADGFISEMENGYASPIAQGGTNVSGGQRQRLAVARGTAEMSARPSFREARSHFSVFSS